MEKLKLLVVILVLCCVFLLSACTQEAGCGLRCLVYTTEHRHYLP